MVRPPCMRLGSACPSNPRFSLHERAGRYLMPRGPPFPKRLVDLAQRLLGKLLPRHRDPDRRLLGVTSERLRRPAPATIEQRICCSNSSVRSVALSHFLKQALDSLSRMVSGEFPDRCNAAWDGRRGYQIGQVPIVRSCDAPPDISLF